jgi:hypothetical protein
MANIQGFGIQLATGGFSLEANTIFATYAEALAYARSAAAYVGKVISVTGGDQKGLYTIEAVGENASFNKVGSDVDLSNYVTKSEISSVYKAKGSVATYEDLPTNAAVGDVYNVAATGKNYVWVENLVDGESGWDDLAGIVDLSQYATTGYVDGKVFELNGLIAANDGAIKTANSLIAKKVDKVDGHSLIPDAKLALIDTTHGLVTTLSNQDLNGRLATLEGLFKDNSGGSIDLSLISGKIGDHEGRIKSLEADNGTNKTNIGTLQSQVGTINGTLSQYDGRIAKNASSIGTLQGQVEPLLALPSAVASLKVKNIKEGDTILSLDASGVLSSNLNFTSYTKDDGKTYIALLGVNSGVVAEFDASAFVKDAMIDNVVFDPDTKNLTIIWNTAADKQALSIPLADLVDTYTAGPGLTLANNVFSARLSTNENNKLTLAEDGSLLVDISEDLNALRGEFEEALTWIDIE